MKKLLLFSLVAFAALLFLSPHSARADVSFDFFYDSLSPYGSWVEAGDYGYCWHPDGIDRDWAPYTDGYWAYTDAGWTWVSYEDFGAITYHYGRWVDIDDEGWCWVPGEEWAPAWVSWRSSDDYVGWAPLPPRAVFTASIGFSTWVDREYDIGPRYYNFCEVRHFGSPALRPLIIDRSRNVTVINNTVNITNITVRGDRNVIYNGGPQFDVVSRRSDRPIQTLRLVQKTDFDSSDRRADRLLARQEGNQLIMAAPNIRKSEGKFKPQKIARVIQSPSVDTGWNKIEDPKVKHDLRAKFDAQTVAKPKDAPAKQISAEEVKVVEERIKAQPASTTGTAEVVGGKHGKERHEAGPGRDVATDQPAGTAVPANDAAIEKMRKKENRKTPDVGVPSVDPALTDTARKSRKKGDGQEMQPFNNPPAAEAQQEKKIKTLDQPPLTTPPDQPVARGKERKNKAVISPPNGDDAASQQAIERQRRDAMQQKVLQQQQQQQQRNSMREENVLKQQQAGEERRRQIEAQQQQKMNVPDAEQPHVKERREVPQQRIQQAPPQIQQAAPQPRKEKGNGKKGDENQGDQKDKEQR